MIDQSNKIEQLEKRINDLERKLEKMVSMEDVNRETEKRLNTYESNIRSDRGDVTLKKNFVIKNRKGIQDTQRSPGVEPEKDNVVTMYFNERNTGRLNHIFLGDSALSGGNYNNSVLSGTVVHKDDVISTNPNNGRVQFSLVREDYLKGDGTLKPGLTSVANFAIFAEEVGGEGKTGDSVGMYSRGDSSASSGSGSYVYHINTDTGDYNSIQVDKDGFWKESGNLLDGTSSRTAL